MLLKKSFSDKAIVIISYISAVFLAFITFYPFWDLLITSISPKAEAISSGWKIITLNPSFIAYKQVLSSISMWRSISISVFRVVVGTFTSVMLTSMTAYPLSKKKFPLNKLFTVLVIITMYFNGGLIPTYLFIKSMNLIDNLLVLILPSAVTAYNLIIMRNFLRTIPDSIEESAKIDGATDFTIWRKLILPLSTPVLATVSLWVAVFHWNSYFDALLYIREEKLVPLQVVLRRVLIDDETAMLVQGSQIMNASEKPLAETSKAALIMVSSLPIIMVYPFLQKHFVKGIMLGSVKG